MSGGAWPESRIFPASSAAVVGTGSPSSSSSSMTPLVAVAGEMEDVIAQFTKRNPDLVGTSYFEHAHVSVIEVASSLDGIEDGLEFALAVQDRVGGLAFVGCADGNQNVQRPGRGRRSVHGLIAECVPPREDAREQGRSATVRQMGSLEGDAEQMRTSGLEDQFKLLRAARSEAGGELCTDVAGENDFADCGAKLGEFPLSRGADAIRGFQPRPDGSGAEEVGVRESESAPGETVCSATSG